MVYEIVQYLLSMLTGAVMGGIVASAFIYRFARRCTNLEWAIGDLQSRASSFKGKEMAEKRWEKQKKFEEEMAAFANPSLSTKRRYDNDPLGE
jgi:hypothetical protein